MDAIENLLTRKSVRRFSDKAVSEEDIHTILKAGMSGPSATNARPWSIIVVTDRDRLNAMAEVNGSSADALRGAAFGVLVCGDTDRAFPKAPDYWIIDAAIVAQNMILAAHDLGIGSVWLGTWPQSYKVEGQEKLFGLPKNIIPHSIVAFGYPEEGQEFPERDLYEADRVHFEKW